MNIKNTVVLIFLLMLPMAIIVAQEEVYEQIDEDACVDCHEESAFGTDIETDIENSIHDGIGCLDCHIDKNTDPHKEDTNFYSGCEGCRTCHEDASEEYQGHGAASYGGNCEDLPHCSDCHGDHNVLPVDDPNSIANESNLIATCGKCHEDVDLTSKYATLKDHPVEIYKYSVHGLAADAENIGSATCNDCHATDGTSHKIYSPGHNESAINHFNIPETCGKCHAEIEQEYTEGIHGELAARGETDSPVCTYCHGEHGIIAPDDPRSPVSKFKVAELTCSPCHESAVLNEKYGLPTGRVNTFIDSYHGLKSKAGDTHVANCASCHGVHKILPSSNPASSIHPDNLQETCGECHPNISERLAATPIHALTEEDAPAPIARVIEKIYIIAIIAIVGFMIFHWLIDLFRQIIIALRKPQVRRMHTNEVIQHTFTMISFIVLVISGFALRFSDAWISRLFFGWEGGFEMRGVVHRIAAIIFMLTVIWHAIYLVFTERGKAFFKDMLPNLLDFTQFYQKIMYNLGRRSEQPRFRRFSYIEKIEYWALVWGTVIMIITGIILWFDNYFSLFLPKEFFDVSLVIHYWEAWLATLAIAIWHLYSTLFNPQVYPMNPAWLTGKMPEDMYEHEHPEHLDEAKKEENN